MITLLHIKSKLMLKIKKKTFYAVLCPTGAHSQVLHSEGGHLRSRGIQSQNSEDCAAQIQVCHGGPDLLRRPLRLLLHGSRPRAAATTACCRPESWKQCKRPPPPLLLLGSSESRCRWSLAPRTWRRGPRFFASGAKLLGTKPEEHCGTNLVPTNCNLSRNPLTVH